jgi:amidohydrolase
VIPQRGGLTGTLRLADRAAWEAADGLVAELVAQILAPTWADYRRGVPPVDNDAHAVAVLHAAVTEALGAGAVDAAPQSTGAEDFALFLEHMPGTLARLGVWDPAGRRVDLYSPSFRADERCIAAGVRTLVHTVLASRAGR